MSSQSIDRLSTLPHNILTNILSFLPTKTAATTSILSRPWRYLWTQVTALRFTGHDFFSDKFYATCFCILQRVTWRKIQTIELNIKDQASQPTYYTAQPTYYTAHPTHYTAQPNKPSFTKRFYDLVYDGDNVTQIKLHVENFTSRSSRILLPFLLFEKTLLEQLEIGHGFYMLDRGVINLPNLKKLVFNIRDEGDDQLFLVGKLVESCPLLNVLRIQVDLQSNKSNQLKIIGQKLNWLSIDLVSKLATKDIRVVIGTPNLKFLQVRSSCIVTFGFLNTPSVLVKAQVSIGDGKAGSFASTKQLINPIFRVSTLSLGGAIVPSIGDCGFETFHKLTHLEMILSCGGSWTGLKNFLQKCPNLQSLVLRKDCATWDSKTWSGLDILPGCLKTKIQRIEMWNFDGSLKCEFKIISYILNVAKELKVFDIWIDVLKAKDPRKKEACFRQEVSKLKKTSKTCEIMIMGKSLGS